MPAADNVVFILTDDQATWALGCYGNSEISTPNLDRLAKSGARLQNFFVSSPVCSPSRATYLTGLINSQHGVHDWVRQDGDQECPPALLAGRTTYVDVMAAHGYSCSLSGKWHLGEQELPLHGFERHYMRRFGGGSYVDPEMVHDGKRAIARGYASDLFTDDAIEFIASRAGRQAPFYASVHFTAPHSPWYGHPQDIVDSYDDCPFESCPQEEPHPWMGGSPTEFKGGREMLKGYFAAVTAMDRCVGRILNELERLGVRERTLVVFCSDNGFNFGHHGVWGKGNGTFPFNMYETSVKVPCIFSHPGVIPAGQVLSGLHSNYDMFPTLLEYLGLPIPAGAALPGKSLVPALLGKEDDAHDAVVVYDEYGGTRMVRTRRWKYIHRYDHGPCELFDLRNDPGERRNLLYDPGQAARIVSLRRLLEDFFDTWAEARNDGRELDVRGFGQGADLSGDRDADRAIFYHSWYDERPVPVIAALREQGR